MGETMRFQETLRRLAMIDEGFVEDQAGLGLGLRQPQTSTLAPKTVALLQLGASVAIGSPAVCVEWTAVRAMAAGATEDEIADVLLAIAPVAALAGLSPPLTPWRRRSNMTLPPLLRKPTVNDADLPRGRTSYQSWDARRRRRSRGDSASKISAGSRARSPASQRVILHRARRSGRWAEGADFRWRPTYPNRWRSWARGGYLRA